MIFLPGMAFFLAATLAGAAPGAQNSGGSHAHDFLIFATVFTERGFALPGAHARARRMGEKKFRWEAFSDQRGEFAIRVPQNETYELTIEARGFSPAMRMIDAREDNRMDLTIRMEPASGAKQ